MGTISKLCLFSHTIDGSDPCILYPFPWTLQIICTIVITIELSVSLKQTLAIVLYLKNSTGVVFHHRAFWSNQRSFLFFIFFYFLSLLKIKAVSYLYPCLYFSGQLKNRKLKPKFYPLVSYHWFLSEIPVYTYFILLFQDT